MTICRQQLLNDGAEIIPRSCPKCKFGPCKNGLIDHHTVTKKAGENMRGKIEIYMNQATMMAAVQLWLDDQFKSPPSVVSVKKNTDTHGAGSDQFIISISGVETPTI